MPYAKDSRLCLVPSAVAQGRLRRNRAPGGVADPARPPTQSLYDVARQAAVLAVLGYQPLSPLRRSVLHMIADNYEHFAEGAGSLLRAPGAGEEWPSWFLREQVITAARVRAMLATTCRASIGE